MTAYAELAIASNFTFLTGASHPEEWVATAARLGLAAVAITDRNTVAGIVRGHVAAKEAGLRFVVGCRLAFADGTPDILAWPSDRAAYGRLCRLLTLGNRRAEKGDCRLELADLLAWGEGMVLAPLPGRGALGTGAADLAVTLDRLRESFGREWVRLAAQPLFGPSDRRRLTRLAGLAESAGVGLLAVGDLLHHVPARRPLADVLAAIREGVTLDDAGRRLAVHAERHLRDGEAMARLFRDQPRAVAESVALLERLTFSLEELRYEYPEEDLDGAANPQEALVRLTRDGAARRWPDGVPASVEAALAHEFAIVGELGYAPYFLTVHDIVRFARARGILAQGRGSAANSAICFCLGITEVDPVRGGLLFERFISPERKEPPDIDVDFEHERREEVIQYIYAKYGRDRAGLAASLTTYRSRSALREVGKVFGLGEDAIAGLTGTVWGSSSKGPKDEQAARAGLSLDDPTLARVFALSREIVGFPRHLSQHVGGFVITRGRLDEVVPIQNAAMVDRTVIEWDKDDLDALGILKIDILALGMLSALRKGFDLIESHYGRRIGLADIPAEDPAVYRMVQRADTVGVFQIESRAQMTMLPRLKPATFYDLVIEVAIVRPGPIQGDMVHPYLRRRQGLEQVTYHKPELEAVLGKTLGVPLFQEQAMRIAIVAGGFSPAEADKLRRAMATFRRVGTIHSFQTKMVEGMVAKGYPRDFAERCFRQIEGFGEYGFPESHAASFALLVYASAWMKCHLPDVFACALVNSQPMGFYAPAQVLRDAREHGVEIRPVDVNASQWDCTLEPGPRARDRVIDRHADQVPAIRARHALRLGFRQVKGLAEAAVERLIAARGRGYDSVADVAARSGLERGVLERLAEADAFAGLGLDRRAALWAVEALETRGAAGSLPLLDRAELGDLFAAEPAVTLPPMLPGEEVIEDYRTLSLSLKGHPVAFLRTALAAVRTTPAVALAGLRSGAHVRVAGLVLVRQRPGTASGVIFLTLEDEGGVANVIVWPKVFEKFRPVVLGGRLIAVDGRLQNEQGVIHIVADKLVDRTAWLSRLSEAGGEIRAEARADEVAHPVIELAPKIAATAPLTRLVRDTPELAADVEALARQAGRSMPKGRNFH
ncbi:error-prone DNA polymerase [Siculibacillus lacustris]|uniref:Error-prone DNA polymerase n=1 Tax=Siculibacillus lacustris TaxID=1549641 RepID=A0A4Q9VIV6_9HYPH|nr:error-prone DNA polymerase [Siculibacillus lacustris]TBW35210.1 error-prone DNA polymerase [Siculibacillus lacustris]